MKTSRHTGNQPRTGQYLRLVPPLSRTAAVALATELEALKQQTWTSQMSLLTKLSFKQQHTPVSGLDSLARP